MHSQHCKHGRTSIWLGRSFMRQMSLMQRCSSTCSSMACTSMNGGRSHSCQGGDKERQMSRRRGRAAKRRDAGRSAWFNRAPWRRPAGWRRPHPGNVGAVAPVGRATHGQVARARACINTGGARTHVAGKARVAGTHTHRATPRAGAHLSTAGPPPVTYRRGLAIRPATRLWAGSGTRQR